MKRLLPILVLLALVFASLLSCASSHEELPKQTANEIPEQSITYTNFTFGNVIQDGKQAIFLVFVSDYTITKMEIAGTLLDKNGNAIHSFDTSMTLGIPSYNPKLAIRIEKDLIKNVKSVSFTKIKAYTMEKVDLKANE